MENKVHKFLSAIFVYLLLSLSAHADDFDDAIAAYKKGDYKTAVKLWKPLAEKGDVGAQAVLGALYADGGYDGVPEDNKQASKWFRLAAEQGDADAQFMLGALYANGEGVPEDDKEAVKWWRLAAEQGNAEAQFMLGVMYRNGEGVPEDKVLAYVWWNLAAANGNENASKNKGIIAKGMTSSQIAEAQKLSRDCLKNNYKDC
jgi:uncharacterized protein